MLRVAWWLAAALIGSGCVCQPSVDAGTDAAAPAADTAFDGLFPDAGAPVEDPRLVVGEGESELVPIEDGRTLLLARGCQGSQHVWISLRAAAALDPRGMTVRLDLFRVRDDLRVSLEFLVRLSFTADASGETSSLLGLTLQVPMPEIAIGEDIRLEAEITDRAGTSARVERIVRVDWGTEVCGSMGGG